MIKFRIAAVCVAAAAALLAAGCGTAPTSAASSRPASQLAGGAPVPSASQLSSTGDCDSLDTCYTPHQLQVAYGIKPLLDRGINGRGETVVFPELAESQLNPPLVTDMRQDMAAFDRRFQLPTARMRVVTTLAGASSPWLAFGEEVLDVELVHALAPDATLGSVMSISAAGQIGGEHCVSRAQADSVNAAIQAAVNRRMTVVAASGDIGAAAYQCDLYAALTGTPPASPTKGVLLLASDPLVLSAGGTALTASHATGAWISETAWGLASGNPGNQGGSFQASGGGFSQLFARPAYQAGLPGVGATRGVPDVSADASDRTGVAVVFSKRTDIPYVQVTHTTGRTCFPHI